MFTYSGDPSSSDKDAVRFEIQDTNPAAPLLQDSEVEWAILNENQVAASEPTSITGATLYGPAARCFEVLAVRFLAQADSEIGQVKITSTKRAEQYLGRAEKMREKAQGFYAPYAGGQSISEKQDFANDPDTVLPAFTREEWDSPYTGSQYGDGFSNEDLGPPVQ